MVAIQARRFVYAIVIAVVIVALVASIVGDPSYRFQKTLALIFVSNVLLLTFIRKPVFVNLAIMLLAVTLTASGFDILIKVFLDKAAGPKSHSFYEQPYHDLDPIIGKKPYAPSVRESTFSSPDGRTIYDVTYTIDKYGFRIPPKGEDGAPVYLFFGGSFTFGEGVADQQAYPYVFSQALKERNTVINLAWHGYGPQEMLRNIEADRFKDALKGPVVRAFYMPIPDHMNRVAGYYKWTINTPRYLLDRNGEVVSAGLYGDHWYLPKRRGGLVERIARYVRNSIIPKAYREVLAVAVIKKSAILLKQKYGAKFTVLLWDRSFGRFSAEDIDHFEADLRRAGIKVTRVSSFLGDLNNPKYALDPSNEHPSAFADRKLGRALAAWIDRTDTMELSGN